MEGLSTIISIIALILVLNLYVTSVGARTTSIGALYQFGDSLSDTGNAGCHNPPYGDTFFHHPTGRCSDGLLIVDYFAQSLKIPLLSPYRNKAGDFSHGVNFAVGGATALNSSWHTLFQQIEWFKTYLSTICHNKRECRRKLGNAMFVMGEIGGNDYNALAFGPNKTASELRWLVPKVTDTISHAVKELIYLGASRIVVPGNFPSGCMTAHLAEHKSNYKSDYDELGCLKSWNDLASYHNYKLQIAINSIQKQHPNVKIVYGDYYSAFRKILKYATSFGFDKYGIQKACCGKGNNEFNFDRTHLCGSDGAWACPNPWVRLSWDGLHLTQHAHQLIAQQVLKTIIPALS